MIETALFNVLEDASRVDVFVSSNLEGFSRSAIQKLIAGGAVTVNDKACKSSQPLVSGDVVSVLVPEPVSLLALPENIFVDVIFEDDDLIVVNKPKGMVVHPSSGHPGGTLVNALLHHCNGKLSGINGVMRPGIVHRIDKDTSGILVVAKTDFAHVSLCEQLATHEMKRVYNAIAVGTFQEDEGTIDKSLARNPNDRLKMAVVKGSLNIAKSGAKQAITHYKVLERFRKHTLLELKLETGRTHQIRVHMASINRPLLGDFVYGNASEKVQGQALHARSLGFKHPRGGDFLEFESALPKYFEELLKKI